MAVSGRLVALAALGLLLVAHPALLAGYAGLLVVGIVADLVTAPRVSGLRISRSTGPSVRLGEAGRTTLTVDNPSGRRLRGRVRDAWTPSAGARPREQRLAVGAGGRGIVQTTLIPTRRGDRTADRVTLRAFGPLGLAARQRSRRVPGSLRVLPAFTSRRFLPAKLARLRQIDGALLVRQRGAGSEFDALREYVVGDDVRAIDWRATARAQDVMVRTWRPERDRQIVLALDTGRTSATRIEDEPRLDAAIDACLLLGAVAARAGDRVAMVAADVAVRARLGRSAGPDVLGRLVTALAPLQPALVETDLDLVTHEVLEHSGSQSLIVLFSPLAAASADGGLLHAARTLAARHPVIVASVADPREAELAAGRGDPGAVYTAAAASLRLAEQQAVTDQLRRLGVRVVDAPPAVLAPQVTDAYLDLKAAARL